MDKTASTDHPIHPLLARRWSSRAYDAKPVPDGVLASLVEAARWAPSCFNEQPWSFIVARRDEDAEVHRKLSECLLEGNRIWAGHAPVLILTLARMHFAHNGKPNHHALHDVGLAAANLSIQATELGLNVHQMAGFDAQRAREVFDIPEGFEPVTTIAVGYRGAADPLPDRLRDAETAPRSRKPFDEMFFKKTKTPSS